MASSTMTTHRRKFGLTKRAPLSACVILIIGGCQDFFTGEKSVAWWLANVVGAWIELQR